MATHPVIGLFSGIIAILLSLKGDGLQESYTQPISPNGIRGIGQEHYVLCNVNSVYGVNHGHYIVADLTCQIHTKSTKICKVNSRSNQLHILISLLLAGDVHPCPGPNNFPCIKCQVKVRANSRAVNCDMCEDWIHIKCADISLKDYKNLIKKESFNYVCDRCNAHSLPFYDSDEIAFSKDFNSEPVQGIKEDVSDNLFDPMKKKGLNFIHLNIRSLLPKIDQLRDLVLKARPTVLGLTETWCDDSITVEEISIPEYICVRKDRNREGGGVCMYIRADVAFNIRSDLDQSDKEAIWVDLLLPKTKTIGVCYRPPKQMDFFQKLEKFLI